MLARFDICGRDSHTIVSVHGFSWGFYHETEAFDILSRNFNLEITRLFADERDFCAFNSFNTEIDGFGVYALVHEFQRITILDSSIRELDESCCFSSC